MPDGAGEWIARVFERVANAQAARDAAQTLLSDPDALAGHLAPMLTAIAADPWSEPPLPARRDAEQTSIILFENHWATVAATITSAAGLARTGASRNVLVSGRMRMTRYIRAGGATLERFAAGPAGDDFRAGSARPARRRAPIALVDGMVVSCDGRCEGHVVRAARRDVVALGVTLHHGRAAVMREYRCDDGALVRVAACDRSAARATLLLGFLRDSGHARSPAFDRASRDEAFFVRWQAMREWLAHDAVAALPRLREMARSDPHGEVRDAAATMRRLVEARREHDTCRA